MTDLSTALQHHQPLVVGAVGTPEVLGTGITRAQCDLIELRLDMLGWGEEVEAFAAKHKDTFPILLTARHPDEGGGGPLSAAERAAAYTALLPHAALIDLELQSLDDPALRPIWDEAAERGVLRIASWHDFLDCPAPMKLTTMLQAMREAGADIAKFAFRIAEPSELQVLNTILRLDRTLALAVMGMGPFAPASRLLAAQLGSVLNYGYLGDQATAPGQWPARLLKEAVAHSPRFELDDLLTDHELKGTPGSS